jgi:hypothetical protein
VYRVELITFEVGKIPRKHTLRRPKFSFNIMILNFYTWSHDSRNALISQSGALLYCIGYSTIVRSHIPCCYSASITYTQILIGLVLQDHSLAHALLPSLHLLRALISLPPLLYCITLSTIVRSRMSCCHPASIAYAHILALVLEDHSLAHVFLQLCTYYVRLYLSTGT